MEEKDLLIHYSASFNNDDMRYHGEMLFEETEPREVEKKKKDIVADVKIELMKKLVKWGFKTSDLIGFEIYYFFDNEEVQVFNYRK